MEDNELQKRNEHVYGQLAEWVSVRTRNKPELVGMLLMYIPLIYMIFAGSTFGIMGMILMMMAVGMFAMFYERFISKKREGVVAGNSYIDSILRLPDEEVVEQITVNGHLRCLVKPLNPYPYHKVRIQDEDLEAVLRPLGVDFTIGTAESIRLRREELIADEVEARLYDLKELAKEKAKKKSAKEKEKPRGRGRPKGSPNKPKKRGIKDE